MARLTQLSGLLLLLLFSSPANGAGIVRVYSLPCGPGAYTVIPIAGFTHKPPYTLYAADGVTILAGPQVSNVFTNIPGTVGSNFQVTVINVFSNLAEFTTITLNAGTSIIDAEINCACTLGIPPDCRAVPRADSITGATYLWTSPSGLTCNRSSGCITTGNPPGIPENGVWTVSATLNTGTCIHTLTNSVTLSNCFSGLPVKLIYFRASGTCTINVEWATAQEQNSDRFEIETSRNAVSGWEKVSVVTAAGNSPSEITYREKISVSSNGILFIRLKDVDKDGHFNYSNVIKTNVECDAQGIGLSVFPGIMTQNSSLALKVYIPSGKDEYYVLATDISGRQLFRKRIGITMPESHHTITLNGIGKGIYFIRVVNAETGLKSNVARFMIQ